MSPTKISPISLVVVVNLVGYSNSWVFTDINYTQLKRDFIDVDLFGNELTDEDLKPLKFSLIYPGRKSYSQSLYNFVQLIVVPKYFAY